jgi:hypothetical protein
LPQGSSASCEETARKAEDDRMLYQELVFMTHPPSDPWGEMKRKGDH